MSEFLTPKNEFLKQVIAIIEANLHDEDFSVEDLAEELNMSRSSLLRKIKEKEGVSVSVYIRKVRLHHAKEMLKDDTLNASEVSYKVGFNSVSYFTKCYREEFGVTPGSKIQEEEEEVDIEEIKQKVAHKTTVWSIAAGIVLIGAIALLFILQQVDEPEIMDVYDKSIAVLPFKNDSNDSTNVYIINGLMEAVLDNLAKIEELEVTSRTTSERYRGSTMTVPELFNELGVNYFVEGSGQKMGEKLLLTIQLIDAREDKHLWSQRFERDAKDIFQLQSEVAKRIAEQIQVSITPEERERIEEIPTENLVAYDHYLKGLEVKNASTLEELYAAIDYFKLAIEEDNEFDQAYAYVAICYYFVDLYQANKQFGSEINTYADKALLLAPEQPESLIAKGMFYMQDGQFEFAASHFERVLEISPGSAWVRNFLTDIYVRWMPNPKKYMEHALQGLKIAVADQDSITASFTYLHLSNAMAQTGFIREAEDFILTSLAYDPKNIFSQYVQVYIQLAQNFNLAGAKEDLLTILDQDTTRLDVVQEIAKVCYTMRDFEESWWFYNELDKARIEYDLNIYVEENIKIAYVLYQLGEKEMGDQFAASFLAFAETDDTIYANLNMAAYHATVGNIDEGIEYLRAFTEEKDYMYWLVLFMDEDPILQELSAHPDFESIAKQISENFWRQHKETRKQLEDEGII